MSIRTLVTALTFAVTTFAAGSLHAVPVLVNFSGDPISYTSDGVNTWQTFIYDADGNGHFDSIPSTALVDANNDPTGLTFQLTPEQSGLDKFGNAGASQSDFAASKPATGFDWFDESSPEQRATTATNSSGYVAYIFSGFALDDDVTFDFVFGRSFTSSRPDERRIDFLNVTDNVLLLNDAQTAIEQQYVTTTLTGSTSYRFEVYKSADNQSPSSVVNAARISIAGDTPPAVPEPATLGLALLGIAALVRGRRSQPR